MLFGAFVICTVHLLQIWHMKNKDWEYGGYLDTDGIIQLPNNSKLFENVIYTQEWQTKNQILIAKAHKDGNRKATN